MKEEGEDHDDREKEKKKRKKEGKKDDRGRITLTSSGGTWDGAGRLGYVGLGEGGEGLGWGGGV